MNDLPRAELKLLFDLIQNLITCGFRGSAQLIVDEHVAEYINKTKECRLKGCTCGCGLAIEEDKEYEGR